MGAWRRDEVQRRPLTRRVRWRPPSQASRRKRCILRMQQGEPVPFGRDGGANRRRAGRHLGRDQLVKVPTQRRTAFREPGVPARGKPFEAETEIAAPEPQRRQEVRRVIARRQTERLDIGESNMGRDLRPVRLDEARRCVRAGLAEGRQSLTQALLRLLREAIGPEKGDQLAAGRTALRRGGDVNQYRQSLSPQPQTLGGRLCLAGDTAKNLKGQGHATGTTSGGLMFIPAKPGSDVVQA